jgi:transposase-like protein
MYRGYEKLVATYFPRAAHQFCWFHINCFHIGAMVRRAKSGYRQAQQELKSFEHNPL